MEAAWMSGSPLKLFQRRPSGWRSLDPICSKFFIRCASQPVRELSKVIIEESLKVLNCDRISLFVFDKRIEMSLGDISTIRIGRPPSSTFWKRKNRPVYTLLGVSPVKYRSQYTSHILLICISPIAMLCGLAKLIGARAPSGHRQSWWADGVKVIF